MLFANETELAEIIEHQENAFLAKEKAEGITSLPEWHLVKRDILKCIIREKLRCNPDIAAYLSSTKGKYLVENVRNDAWRKWEEEGQLQGGNTGRAAIRDSG